MSKTYIINALLAFMLVLNSTHLKAQTTQSDIHKTIFLFGDGGALTAPETFFEDFSEHFKKQNKTIALFLGDNIYEKGLQPKNHPQRSHSEELLLKQWNGVKNVVNQAIFIPGNHDWYHDGYNSIKEQRKFINDQKEKKLLFYPKTDCPIESVSLSDNIQLIVVDSQWYLENWDNHPTINKNCSIKSKEKFLDELNSEIQKFPSKNVLLALHHPLITYGDHGGNHGLKSHLFPLKKKIPMPGLATLGQLLRSPGGVIKQDVANARYNDLIRNLTVMLDGNPNVIVVSGHDHNLQLIEAPYFTQIVSGSISKQKRLGKGPYLTFGTDDKGFIALNIFEDGSIDVAFYTNDSGKTPVFSKKIPTPFKESYKKPFSTNFPETIKTSVYSQEQTNVSGFHKMLWGDHYREIYGTPIEAKVALLDTLYGGLTPLRAGGGMQTNSLRLMDKEGKQFVMRAVRKNVTRLIQKEFFNDVIIDDGFEETLFEELLLDQFTASHPYAALVIPDLAQPIGLLQAIPELFYIPKQPALENFNHTFGDELYLIEERAHKAYSGDSLFNEADKFRNTDDMLDKIFSTDKNRVDEVAFIRARIFDMLVGDWDRHEDQWRWAEFKDIDGIDVFRPIPRDRDQVFSNFDGTIYSIIKFISPSTKRFAVYDSIISKSDLKWFNIAGGRLDDYLLSNSDRSVWLEQTKLIQQAITDEVIEKAFSKMPEAAKDDSFLKIKQNLKARRNNLSSIVENHYDYFIRHQIIMATHKDDFIDIERLPDGKTHVMVSRNIKGNRERVLVDRIFDSKETKEIWIYGLDDKDHFTVSGDGPAKIRLRLIGGYGDDMYNIQNGKNVKVYDWKFENNVVQSKDRARINFNNHYDTNTLDTEKDLMNVQVFVPNIGFNPDDGFFIGTSTTFIKNGFIRHPFTHQHTIKTGYFFATQGVDLSYQGIFARALGKFNLETDLRFTSDNFAQNFFGFGNQTQNLEDDEGLDFNRVKMSIYQANIKLRNTNLVDLSYYFKAGYESVEVEETSDRFIETTTVEVEDRKHFYNATIGLEYDNLNNKLYPTRGMQFFGEAGASTSDNALDGSFGFFDAQWFTYFPITKMERWVLKTSVYTQLRTSANIEFYQAANLGGNNGLRAYRTERFTGKNSLAGGADLRFHAGKVKTGIVPLRLGVFAGADAGRVWLSDDHSDKWHRSYGGGLWITGAEMITGTFQLFNGDDGLRFSAVLIFGF